MAKKKARRKKPGPKPKLRHLSQRNILLRALRQGMSLEDAAYEAGCCFNTFNSERKSNAKFGQQVNAALMIAKRRLIRRWAEKKPDTLAAIRYPDEYARKDKFSLQQIVELHDEWLEGTLTFVPEERHEAFKEMLNAKLTRVAIKAGVLPPENA